jgi:hypothetical protein
LAATAAPDPELEPHGLWSSTYGLRHWPARPDQPLEDWVERKLAHSDRLALPRITAPARRSRRTTNASRGTWAPTRASDPAVVSILSRVSKLSLTRMGMPCRGPRGPFRRRSASSSAAISTAAGLTSITELSWIPDRSMRRMRRR